MTIKKRAQLTPEQLCDLLNYVLHRAEPIEVFVVKSWAGEYGCGRYQVQAWCEAVLRFRGLLPQRHERYPGRRTCLKPPERLKSFCNMGEIAQLRA